MIGLSTLKTHLWCPTSSYMILPTIEASFCHRSFSKGRNLRWRSQLWRLWRSGGLWWTNKINPWTRGVFWRVWTLTLLWWLPGRKTKPFFLLKITPGSFFPYKLLGSQSKLYHFLVTLIPKTDIFFRIFKLNPSTNLEHKYSSELASLGTNSTNS